MLRRNFSTKQSTLQCLFVSKKLLNNTVSSVKTGTKHLLSATKRTVSTVEHASKKFFNKTVSSVKNVTEKFFNKTKHTLSSVWKPHMVSESIGKVKGSFQNF